MHLWCIFSMWSIHTKQFNNMTTRGHLMDVWGQTLAALLKLCRQFPGRMMIDFSPCFHWMMSALLHAPLKPFSFGNMTYITHIIQGTDLLWFTGTAISKPDLAFSDVVYGKCTMHIRQYCIRKFLFPYYLGRCDFDSWLMTVLCFHLLIKPWPHNI